MSLAPTLPQPSDDGGGPLTRMVAAAAQGDHAAVEQVLAAHPEQAAELRASMQRLDQLGLIRPRQDPAPQAIGPYRILGLLGQGGMGSVYLAEQRAPVQRRVALKVIKLGMDSEAVLARFQAERQSLAMMNHECIARVFDAGATERGQPYFAMEHVPGLTITEHCDRHRLTIVERLHLFQKVCAGVQHAHQKGIIHRDLKPSNILVTTAPGEAVPKIIDFGIARATDSDSLAATVFTAQGMILGTPEYMSPEQADGGLHDLDTRTDIYSLGVVLYELLVGELPFATTDLQAAGLLGLHRMIREQEPPKPSTRVRTQSGTSVLAAEQRRSSTASLGRALRGDLDWIVLRALEKDRSRRYASAAAFADDIGRHLANEPVAAGPPSASYRLRKLARRYRAALVAGALVLAALTLGLGLATKYWFEAHAQALEATRLAGVADRERDEARRQTSAAEAARAGEAARASEAAENAAIAQRNAEEARARKAEFDQLAGVVHLRRALENEAHLYPAWPGKVAAMKEWLNEDAARVLAMQPEIGRTLDNLRARALAPAADDVERDRRSHPRHGEWQRLSAKLAALTRAHEIRSGKELTLPVLNAAEQAMPPSHLNVLAWPRVDPDDSKRIFGEEARALVLAQLAWEKSNGLSPRHRATFADTLAWAWFANGKDAEAVAQSEAALALAAEDEKSAYAGQLASLRTKVREAAVERGNHALAALRAELAQLTAIVSTRRTHRFADESQRFLHDTLRDLHDRLTSFARNEHAAVLERVRWAEQIESLTLGHPGARVTWQAARQAIAKADGVVASTSYAGQRIDLRDQDVTGLVPIGMNPVTKLWEFYDLRSAWDGASDPRSIEIPQHILVGERAGCIEVGKHTGIVFVLLPGGTFTMGSQDQDPDAPNYDPARHPVEGLHQATLSPFFLAKHELTLGQWWRLSDGRIPTYYEDGSQPDGRPRVEWFENPVEHVDWHSCTTLLKQHGMLLPTEAQWEYGCRAGTITPWFCPIEDLQRHANLADASALRSSRDWACEEWNDGHAARAPAGSFAPNAFGLHDMLGNVWEWTRDGDHGASAAPTAGDGLRGDPYSVPFRVYRGGSFGDLAKSARSATRSENDPSVRGNILGLRAARALRP